MIFFLFIFLKHSKFSGKLKNIQAIKLIVYDGYFSISIYFFTLKTSSIYHGSNLEELF